MFQKSSLKTYPVIVSIVVLIVILIVNLKIYPALEETLTEISPIQAEETKNRLFYITVGLLIFIFLGNFYLWRVDGRLEKEEKEIESNLKLNPSDQIFREKLERIRNKRKHYMMLIEPVFMIILGAVIGFMVVSILKPLYSSLGTF